ncbi:MAG: YlbF family regulator [Lachnospiraceae bacterium]|nr:YlbF family regulator [Lachnospiraceae bacterium]
MDSKIEQKAKELAELVRNSQEYKNYLLCREALQADKELYGKVNNFRRENFLLQVEGEPDKLYDEMGRMQNEFAPVRKDERVSGFLQNEHYLCRLLQHIDEVLLEELDFDIEFLEENHG